MDKKYQSLLDNYINGNLSDFKEGLENCSKKEILLVIVSLAEYLSVKNDYENKTYSDNGYWETITIVDKYL
jgi:hypothetical protein